jgi:hypothetical protein
MELNPAGPWRRSLRFVRFHLPRFNFITLHYTYFIFTCLVCAVIFWGASTPKKSVPFTDSLFFTVSAMTEAGLNTINVSTLNTFQQTMLFLLIIVGSSNFVSASVVLIRRRAFVKRFRTEIEKEDMLRASLRWLNRSRRSLSRKQSLVVKDKDETPEDQPTIATSDSTPQTAAPVQGKQTVPMSSAEVVSVPAPAETDSRADRTTFSDDTRFRGRRRSREDNNPLRHILSMQGVGARPGGINRRLTIQGPRSPSQEHHQAGPFPEDDAKPINKHGSFKPSSGYLGRNSNFHHLTESDRHRLGGYEYKAVVFLSWVVPIYCFVWQFLGALSLGAYVNRYYSSTCRENGLDPW